MKYLKGANIEDLLSEKETDFIGLLNTVECMSVYEANYIMQKYMKCSDKQVMKLLNHLKRKYYLSVTSDSKYIMAGSRSRGLGEGELSRDMIVAFWIALMQFAEDKEPFENIKYNLTKAMGGDGILTFLSNGQLYRIHKITSSELYKIKIIEEKYNKKSGRLNNDKYTKNTFDEISIFLFTETNREDFILNKLEELNISIPHSIVILSNSDISTDIAYDKYDMHEE